MLIVPLEYSDSLCELRDEDNRLLIVGKVGMTTNDYLEIINPYSRLPLIDEGANMRLQLYNDEIGFRMAKGRVIESCEEYIRLSELRQIVNNERRNFFRVFVRDKIRAGILQEPTPQLTCRLRRTPEPAVPKWFEVFLVNISLGGAYFTSAEKLKMFDKIMIELPVGKCEALNYRVSNITRLDSGKLGYGCVYMNDSAVNTDCLCAFILDQQRKMLYDNSQRY